MVVYLHNEILLEITSNMFQNTITQLVRPAVAQARTSSVSYSFSTSSRYADESSVPDGSSLASERMKKLLLAIPPELEVPLPGKKIDYSKSPP